MTIITNPAAAFLLLGGTFGYLGLCIAAVSMNMPKPLPVDKTIIAKGVRITRGLGDNHGIQ
ncbi:MAG: hypothetical protein V4564_07620 [Pseudomonadota bacterium]